jgi:hypothetical protein
MDRLQIPFGHYLAKLSLTQKIIWLLFCATSLQLAFLQPYLVLIPGERANLFSGLLCALTLGAVWFFAPKGAVDKKSPEVLISLALALLVLLSGLFSLTPGSSSARGFVVLASGLGGFWCARILLTSESPQRFFMWFCLVMLAGILLESLIARLLLLRDINQFMDANPHTLVAKILLLWFAPLSLLLGRSYPAKIAAVLLLTLSYWVFYLSGLRSAVLIPLILGIMAVLFGVLRLKYLVIILIPLLVIIGYFFHHLPQVKIGKEFEPAYYRVENYPFSWHIALKHPFLGIGLWAPRDEFLKDYEIKYPYATREDFIHSLKRVRTSENIFLTFMAELGFPFLILYLGSLAVLFTRLVKRVARPSPACFLPPLALLLPLCAALLHFQVLDGLMHPQISWFFHILLGLIPPGDRNAAANT